MKTFSAGLALGVTLFSLAAPVRAQQLADTIWEAEVEINAINLQAVKEGTPIQGPNLKNGTIVIPLEIWFWDNTRCGLVFPTEKWNFRDSYEWTWGVPGDPDYNFSRYLGPKYWGGGSLAPSSDNEEGKVEVTSTYAFNAAKRSGSFLHKTLYLIETSTRYEGSFWQLSGTFSITGNRLTVRSSTYTLQPNPSGLNSYRVLSSPRLKKGTVFVKTNRKPSTEVEQQAAFKPFSENSWD